MIQKHIQQLQTKIQQCAQQCGRSPQSIKLLAVSKKKETGMILEAYQSGQKLFGENYIQEAAEKIPALPPDLRWHFIGHLQRNKARQAARLFDVIQTVDSLKLAKLLDKHAAALQKKLSVLLQVNIGAEHQKAGIASDDAERLLTEIREKTTLQVCGLMVIPPYSQHQETSRNYYIKTRLLAESLAQKSLFTDNKQVELSMGMSGDYQVAIEEGSTIVRIGTAVFGPRE
ncbi:MAG: YggS family pyridoxal phosphate-dependent enzyme [Desulfobulbus propionicus]|nr:MAG: YggS family pyridoxal phosphate-dependent enzyme [Desulfobulbus propionicus]